MVMTITFTMLAMTAVLFQDSMVTGQSSCYIRNAIPSLRPFWTDTHPTNIICQWRDEWKSAPVVNSSLVDDPTIRQPRFDLSIRYWALLNHFQTKQSHRTSRQKKWGLQQLSLLPSVGREMSTSQSAVMLCGWGVKAGMVHSTCG